MINLGLPLCDLYWSTIFPEYRWPLYWPDTLEPFSIFIMRGLWHRWRRLSMVVDRIGWQIGKDYHGRRVDSLECNDQPPRPPPSVRHCGFYRYQRKWQALSTGLVWDWWIVQSLNYIFYGARGFCIIIVQIGSSSELSMVVGQPPRPPRLCFESWVQLYQNRPQCQAIVDRFGQVLCTLNIFAKLI